MQIFTTQQNHKDLCIALGFFDGVHFAHQLLLQKTVEYARENGLKSAVLTFQKSPYSIINNLPAKNITTFDKKAELIEKLGIDYLFALDFNEIKELEAKVFIDEILIKHFAPKFVLTGFNHTFGKNGKGNPELLDKQSAFKYISLEQIQFDNMLVSSTNIRNFIKDGAIERANSLLNRNFSIKGEVIKGAQIARKLGRNTANIIWNEKIIKPPYGVYFGRVKDYPALINFGIRPTVDKELKETLEVHLMGFDGDLYNKTIEVEFYKKMRDEKKFNSMEELKRQIEADFAEASLISKFYF